MFFLSFIPHQIEGLSPYLSGHWSGQSTGGPPVYPPLATLSRKLVEETFFKISTTGYIDENILANGKLLNFFNIYFRQERIGPII